MQEHAYRVIACEARAAGLGFAVRVEAQSRGLWDEWTRQLALPSNLGAAEFSWPAAVEEGEDLLPEAVEVFRNLLPGDCAVERIGPTTIRVRPK